MIRPNNEQLVVNTNTDELQRKMEAYAEKMIRDANKGRQNVRQFAVGEKVLIRNFPHKQK